MASDLDRLSIPLPARAVPPATLRSWTPWPGENPHLLGHCVVCFSGGWIVHDVPVFRTKGGGISVGVPSLPRLDRDGRVRLKADGKRDYSAVITFTTDIARARWNEAILAALADGGISPGAAP